MDLEETAQTPFGKNLTMLTDFYEITMANGYFTNGFEDKIVYFDMFFRKIPDGGGFAIMAGVQQLVEYLQNLSFTPQDLDYLRSTGKFNQAFINYLANFHFECDVWAVPEGTPIFPGEPIVTVRGPVIQAQFIETMVLLCVNHQTLIATKANRIVRAASGRSVMEFGSRRAQGFDGAVYGARAAYIGGCTGTACTICERDFGIPAMGTMAHSWVQLFDTELDAFRAYAREYPNQCVLLVDTYNVLQSGIPNAIRIFNEELVPQGFRPAGIRIDSGDITYLSRKAREMLDAAGFEDCGICASNSLDEYIIRDMLMQGAQVDSFGVGERMITSASEPVFGGVYKLVAVEREDGSIEPKIKISENVAKITTPGFKRLWRLFDRYSGKAIADVITLHDELIDDEMPYVIFDPEYIWKRKRVENFRAVPLMTQIFRAGQCIMQPRDLHEIREYCTAQVDTLWEEVTRFENPHRYYVDLSQQLWQIKDRLITNHNFDKPADPV
ncbi:nicotinate phosphoribosyltransferase [Faecalispora jeddahensis]|uniref:nicotinate phosphoribosyltransferase n=1 Tax=Faecalispora jeddahensis TaxID=1414721 RepID=UPI00145AA69E|nr:nicotinate phosphoribosyltransferase [Faecalispora jeddahensis]